MFYLAEITLKTIETSNLNHFTYKVSNAKTTNFKRKQQFLEKIKENFQKKLVKNISQVFL